MAVNPLLQNYMNQTNRNLARAGTPQAGVMPPGTGTFKPPGGPGNTGTLGSSLPAAPLGATNRGVQKAPQGNPAAGAGGQKPPQNAPTSRPAAPNPQPFGTTSTVKPMQGTQPQSTMGAPVAPQAPFGGVTPQQQAQLSAHGITAEQWQTFARFPEFQQMLLRQTATTAPKGTLPEQQWDPTKVTHTINGQRVVLDPVTGNVQMQQTPNGARAAIADTQTGQATGQVLKGTQAVPPASLGPQAAAPTPAAPTSYADILKTQFGTGNPFGMQDFYGGNPLETARASAQRALDENLAKINAQYAANGLGNSARAGITSGQAIADFGTGLADVLATRGQAARDSDANRGLQAMLGAGNQNLQGQQIGLLANQQLADLGKGINAIGGLEQGIPNVEALLTLLGLFNTTTTKGRTTSDTQTGSGFLGY